MRLYTVIMNVANKLYLTKHLPTGEFRMTMPSQYQLYDADAGKQGEPTGLVSDFQRFSIHDGPGIRTIVFLKGCPLHCLWCQNPETLSLTPEIMLIPHNCIGCGKCAEVCPASCISFDTDRRVSAIDRGRCRLPECGECQKICYANAINISGRDLTASQVLEEMERDREFYERTGGGMTVSGGEPFAQPHFLTELLRAAKTGNLHTAVETCGQTQWSVISPILPFIDLFLYDIKHMDPEKHRRLTGVANQLILENLQRIDEYGTPFRVRLPLVPGLNDGVENVRATARFVAMLPHLEAMDILPYHRMGEPKWGQLDRSYALHSVRPHTKEQVFELADIAREYGIQVTVGG